MKTKEEILREQVGSFYAYELINQHAGVFPAMDEWAKQQAIAFAISYATSKMDHPDRTPPAEDKMNERYEWWLKNDGKLGV